MKKHKNKLIIVTAPSGAGKTTIVHHLIDTFPELAFSISATNRPKREKETDGVDYYFISSEDFKNKIASKEFLEYEEVYTGRFYGTLKSELERLWQQGKCIIFDVEVKGAVNIQKAYPAASLSIFIMPPSKEILLERLRQRNTETPQTLNQRMERAEEELTYAPRFNATIVNDNLQDALIKAENLVRDFLIKK